MRPLGKKKPPVVDGKNVAANSLAESAGKLGMNNRQPFSQIKQNKNSFWIQKQGKTHRVQECSGLDLLLTHSFWPEDGVLAGHAS